MGIPLYISYSNMKFYTCTQPNYPIMIMKGGHVKQIIFSAVPGPIRIGHYATNDEDEIKAIESHRAFGKYIFIKEDDKPKAEEPQHIYAAEFPEVKRTQEANKILVNEYGVDKETLTSKDAAKAAAEKLNINFPNL